MKKRKHICLALALLFVLPLLVSCGGGTTTPGGTPGETPNETSGVPAFSLENLSSKVLKNKGVITCGSFLFTSRYSTIFRYNTATGTFPKACMDPECTGDCPMESGNCFPLQVVDGKLYFWAEMVRQPLDWGHPVYWGSQDLVTGEVKIILESTSIQPAGGPEFVYDGMMYYMRMMLKEDVDTSNPTAVLNSDNYDLHICRIPLTGGNEETLRLAPDETIFVVADGYYITNYTASDRDVNCLFSYDKDFREQTVFLDFKTSGLTCMSSAQYLNGTVYFYSRKDGEQNNVFCSLKLATGELKLLIDKPIAACQVTEDAIYYSLKETRCLYKPEGWDEMTDEQQQTAEEKPIYYLAGAELYACDLDGQNERVVYTDPVRDFIEDYTVIDGVLYGWIYDFDEQSHTWKDRYFGSIDFESGEVTNIWQWTSSKKK
jgi:hypothetical protein